MAYFLPSFFQKRLLRYALSRLELVDTEALDLDGLGIRWGQRSTVELRDIGLKLEKLAALLHLPASSELRSARVRYLKVTIPADIYSSSIICEASGINVHLKLLSEEACPTGQGDGASNSPHAPSSDTFIPNTADLAQSFLEAEPKEEKDELQAAISSRSQVLQRTSASISDDEEELGLGNETVSLPSFVAGFLKGVADRFQVQVDDISFRVDVEMKQDGSVRRQPEDRPDLITALLTVGQVKVDAISVPTATGGDRSPKGRRSISLSDINLALVSEPGVFANYARFAAPPSPSTPVQAKTTQPPSRASSPPPEYSSGTSTLEMTRSTILEPSAPAIDSQRLDRHAPKLEGSVYTYDGRFSDADTEEGETRPYGYLEESQDFADDDKLLDNPAYLDSVINSQIQDDELDELESLAREADQFTASDELVPRPLQVPAHGLADSAQDTHNAVVLALRPRVSELHEVAHFPEPSLPQSRPALPAPDAESDRTPEPFPPIQLSLPTSAPPSETDSSSSTSGSYHQGDLSESRLFSHDEAQSMYMSAMSHGFTARSFMPNMPGAWDFSESQTMKEPVAEYAVTGSSTGGPEQEDNDGISVATPKLTPQSQPALSRSQSTEQQSPVYHPQSDRNAGLSVQASTGEQKSPDVARTFFSIDRIQISIPSSNSDQEDSEESAGPNRRNSNDNPRGPTVKLHESLAEDGLLNSLMRSRGETITPIPPIHDARVWGQHGLGIDNHIVLEVFSAEVHFDIAIGWLVVKVGQKILNTFGGTADDTTRESRPPQKSRAPQAYRIFLDSFVIKFVEHVHGHAYPPSPDTSIFITSNQEETLLQAVISGCRADIGVDDDITTLHLDVTKFMVGFADEELISFSEELKMRESIRDVTSSSQGDIALKVYMSPKAKTVELMTLPLQLNINIQRLEEAMGWVGGLSTILELGSSISSSSSSKGPSKDAPKRPRGVHFESGPPPATAQPPKTAPIKVNARIGGIALNIIGENHYIKLRTTALKLVSRSEGLGVQIDKAKLSGPLPLKFDRDAPATVSLDDLRFEYLFAPKERDLDRLLALITPSKDKYDEDDDIMLDTLFRQRNQGSVLRVTIGGMKAIISRTADMESLAQLGDEISRLSNVTKYLPEDDRPGVLTLLLIRDFEVQTYLGGKVGVMTAKLQNTEAAYISLPSLVAAQIGHIQVARNGDEELVGDALPGIEGSSSSDTAAPVLMARFIADEMDPTIKIKLHGLRAEYSLPSVIAFLGLGDELTTGDVAANMASSIANLAERQPVHSQMTRKEPNQESPSKASKLTVDLRDCVLGLNPRGTPAKGLVVLTNAKFSGTMHDVVSSEAVLDLRKASIMVIDDVKNVDLTDIPHPRNLNSPQTAQVQSLIGKGYVSVCTVSSATATVKIVRLSEDGDKSLDVELKDDLLILETCADSTQTLISIMNGLQPPTPPSVVMKYRTEVLPIQDMIASFTGDAFVTDQLEDATAATPDHTEQTRGVGEELDDEVEYVSVDSGQSSLQGAAFATGSNELLDSFHSQYHVSSSVSDLDFREDHFAQKSAVGGTAHRWDSTQNTYGLSDDSKLQRSPLRVRVRDAHVIWNLFDGYDWQRTRDTISKAVKEVERKATERRARTGSRASPSFDEEEESVIGDCLFNSIYIGIPANKDPRELRSDINRNIDDLVSETGSYATTTTVTGANVRQSQSPSLRGKKLRLSRSKYHKMTFELKGVCADLVVFPPGLDETQSSLDIRVDDVEIFDHVPTSTWKKFATYMHEAGERESGTSMLHLEILTVRPVPELAASEIVLKATLLPLRLHVDQDALDFICRFFEFRDDTAQTPTAPSDVPFVQRAEINAVPVKLDFKPKRVDYAGLRSGRTTELMNFVVLDGADMTMRHVIIYGVSGFDKLGQTLNDIWMPDIKRNQLPGILAGLAPIRSLVNVGGGVKDLVVVPMREYKKDGRIVRSIQKGASAFAKTTSTELLRLGAKLALGTQTVLQSAEDMLTNAGAPTAGQDDDLGDDEDAKKISLYADQPYGVAQGLRGGFRGLERDLLTARDAIVAVPGEVMESGSAKAAAKAVMKRAPTLILRPAIGVTKAVGQTLLGAGNTLDPSNRRKMEDAKGSKDKSLQSRLASRDLIYSRYLTQALSLYRRQWVDLILRSSDDWLPYRKEVYSKRMDVLWALEPQFGLWVYGLAGGAMYSKSTPLLIAAQVGISRRGEQLELLSSLCNLSLYISLRSQGTSRQSTMTIALEGGPPYYGSPHHPDAIHYMSTSPASDPLQSLASKPPAICSAGYAGNLSLHNYRKLLSDSDPFIDGQDGKLLRRKDAALHLNQNQPGSDPAIFPCPMSSPASSPPPLSPSYSPSARSDQDPEILHGFGLSPSAIVSAPLSAPLSATYPGENPHRLLVCDQDTFRDRLESYPEPGTDPECFTRRHTRTRSDSILWSMKKTTATIVDHGTSFEIINPHESLDFARIVSFIEDVDGYSLRASSGHQRDSYIEVINESEVVLDHEGQTGIEQAEPSSDTNPQQVHHDLVGDSPHLPMPSISELLECEEADDTPSNYSRSPGRTRKRPAPLRPRAWTTDEGDLGEPGSPIREDSHFRSQSHVPLPVPSPYSLDGNHPPSLASTAAYYDLDLWYGPHGIDPSRHGHPHPLHSNPASSHNLCPSPIYIPHTALHQQQEIRIQSGITKITDRRKKNAKGGGSGPLKPFKRLYNMFQRKRQ
ncbi:putative autophagy regulatory protein Atg2 [Aspergillus saccharolyticus JOP 1030-1]|uniref:Autophagy-related protein 2 n=1 Tax=Aspergillus saccharolyticus JOP 1030-1 TaxID=1450539 RepID=A0A318ZJ98_9EURO|nr:hypothetical protein BP01DRAFT_364460 [Aspergillus saccharolyticus JOP 1030-1]PYH46897.1 hypothetical protein BP01DRAFT_364460 [Aspergillus saccharolyticus JOP 1030-1]